MKTEKILSLKLIIIIMLKRQDQADLEKCSRELLNNFSMFYNNQQDWKLCFAFI
jgi:hypothetical protein